MRLHPKLTGLGLAGAIVGELMLAGRVTTDRMSGETRLALVNTTPTGDVLTQTALNHIAGEPWHPFQTWLQFFALTAHADVTSRMASAGLIRRQGVRRKFAPTDANTAVWPVARLNLAMQRRERLSVGDAVLAGLLIATGVAQQVLWEHNPAHPSLGADLLPAPLKDLIAQTEAAIGDAVISLR